MRKLDRYTIETRAPKLDQFVCDWLDGNGPRVFNYEGDTFELRDNDGTYEVYVNGEFAVRKKETKEDNWHNIRNVGWQIYNAEIFRDIRENAKDRTLYDYTALLRNENPSYGQYVNPDSIRYLRETLLTKFTAEYLSDRTRITRINISAADVNMGDYALVYEAVLLRMELGLSLVDALAATFSVCGDKPTVDKMREVLLCGEEESSEYDIRAIVTRNIVCHDPDTYDGSFNGTDLTDAELAIKSEFNLAW